MTIRAASVFSAMFGWRPRRQSAHARAGVRGRFEFLHVRAGQVIDRRLVPNLVVDAGIAALAGLAIDPGTYSDPFTYIALGDGSTAVSAGNTTLDNEISGSGADRALATLSRVTDTITNDSARLVKTFTFTGSFAVREGGVFDADTAGTMLCRQTFSAINVVAADTLAVTYTVTFSPS